MTSWQIERLQKGDPSGFFFGGCKVLFHLAEGTFARVYRGQRIDSGSSVAIKVLRQRFVSDPAAVERFNKEAEAGMKLAHPNIVRILDYGDQDRKHYMIMEYVEGANLRDFLKIRPRISPEDAMPLIMGLTKGLKYSIDAGVTHRDIKATNILISNGGEGKLVDFGLATIDADSRTTTMQSQRTVDYSALERTCGSEKGDPRSDIYFLGSVFYQMITGQVPMKEVESTDMLAKMLKRSFSAIVPLSEHRLAPEPELSRVIEKMMRVDLKSRYQTLDEVIRDLEAYEKRAEGGITGIETSTTDEPDFLADFDSLFTYNHSERVEGGSASERAGRAEVKEAIKRQLLCVENQAEIQDAFKKTLTKMGYRVVLMSDPESAVESYRESPPDALIFDFDGLGPEAVDAFRDIHEAAIEESLSLSALVLLGPRQHDIKKLLPTGDRIIVLSKPVKMKHVQSTIQQLAPMS